MNKNINHKKKSLTLFVYIILFTILISNTVTSENNIIFNEENIFKNINNLPDLQFLEVKSWWGYTNKSGIFVDYDVINTGENYHSITPIELNLTFFADDDDTSFGYIIQKSILDPNTWYKGEILGGNYFFNMSNKPFNITIKADFLDTIPESNETNNDIKINVKIGIKILGTLYKKINNELIKINELIELNQYNNYTLSDFGFRHFWSNESGQYNMSLCPKEPYNEYHKYDIKAFFPFENVKMVIQTEPLTEGDNSTLDIILEGNPPNKPNKPFGVKIGTINKSLIFFTNNVEPDLNNLYYKFKWGDGTYSEWLGPYKSEEIVYSNHSWRIPDRYSLYVISKDNNNILSEWSNVTYINIIDKIESYRYNNQFISKIIEFIKTFT